MREYTAGVDVAYGWLEAEPHWDFLSEVNQLWLAQGGLTLEQMKNQREPVYIPLRKIHLYHCDHRGLLRR